MRFRLIVAAALCVAMAAPASALAEAPEGTGSSDTAVAYYVSPDGSGCLILTLAQGASRPVGGAREYGQTLDVQLASGPGCGATVADVTPTVDPGSYRIITLTAAYVAFPDLDLGGHIFDIDVAWVATGSPSRCSESHPEQSFIARCASAHLSGTILDEGGGSWVAQQDSALLRNMMLIIG
jgi:hypothetical protein